jgi:hypothetical protein
MIFAKQNYQKAVVKIGIFFKDESGDERKKVTEK